MLFFFVIYFFLIGSWVEMSCNEINWNEMKILISRDKSIIVEIYRRREHKHVSQPTDREFRLNWNWNDLKHFSFLNNSIKSGGAERVWEEVEAMERENMFHEWMGLMYVQWPRSVIFKTRDHMANQIINSLFTTRNLCSLRSQKSLGLQTL